MKLIGLVICNTSVVVPFRVCTFLLGSNVSDAIIVAPSLTFLDMLKLSCLVFFSMEKNTKRLKKASNEKIPFPQISTMSTLEHNSSRFRKP